MFRFLDSTSSSQVVEKMEALRPKLVPLKILVCLKSLASGGANLVVQVWRKRHHGVAALLQRVMMALELNHFMVRIAYLVAVRLHGFHTVL